MSGLRCGDRCGDCLKVSHLSYKNNIRVLTQCSAERACIASGITADLTLAYDCFLVRVQILDWIFKCNDILPVTVCNDLDQARKCR